MDASESEGYCIRYHYSNGVTGYWGPWQCYGGSGGGGGGGGGGGLAPQTQNPKKPKCKQGKNGEDRKDIEAAQRRAGIDDLLVEPVQSTNSPEGFVSYTTNRAMLLSRLENNDAFLYDTGLGRDHRLDVGPKNIDSRSRLWSGPGLGPDANGVRRSYQITVGQPDRNGGALVYSDFDCINPAEGALPAVLHGVPIFFRRIGRFLGF